MKAFALRTLDIFLANDSSGCRPSLSARDTNSSAHLTGVAFLRCCKSNFVHCRSQSMRGEAGSGHRGIVSTVLCACVCVCRLSGSSGTIIIKCKDLRVLQLDIPGMEQCLNIAHSIEV